MKNIRFEKFVGIDWSGAREVAGGVQVAEFDRKKQNPQMVSVGHGNWRRNDVLQYLKSLNGRTIVGIDFAFSVPWPVEGPWPNENGSVRDVRGLWASVDKLCTDEVDLFSGPVWLSKDSPFRPFIRHHHTRHIGCLYDRNRFRKTEEIAPGNPISIFHMTGAQVGQGSFAGMRLLHALCDDAAIWPFDKVDDSKVVIVEVYPSLFYVQAGCRRPRTRDTDEVFFANVRRTLEHFGIQEGFEECGRSIDKADAIVTAAALSSITKDSNAFVVPDRCSGLVKREGWIFGVPFGESA